MSGAHRIGRPWLVAAGTSVLFGLLAAAAVGLSLEAQGVAMIWPANAFLTAAWLILPRRWGVVCALLSFGFNLAANRLMGISAGENLTFATVNQIEAGAAALLARQVLGRSLRISTLTKLAGLIMGAAVPATLLASTIAALVCSNLFGRDASELFADWAIAGALGMLIVLPAAIMLADRRWDGGLGRPLAERWAAVGLNTLLAWVAFGPGGPRVAVILFPALTLIALRYGPRTAAMAALAMTTVGAPTLVMWTDVNDLSWLASRVHNMQIAIGAALAGALCTGFVVARQRRMKGLLTRKSEIARASRARAVAASRAKSEFLATMSHEIRTPMNSIVGFTELLLRTEDLPEAARRQLRMIDRASGSLLTVVNDILDFSRVEAGQIELSPRATDLRQICQDSCEIVAESARGKGLRLDLRAPEPAALYWLDDQRLRQVLLNLLNNAIKFTAEGAISLTLTLDRGQARFEVADTGPGIPADRLGALFQRFSQLDASITRRHGGSGLGLAICKGLVELMGGRIGVDSVVGEGTTFWLTLPLVACEADDAADEAAEGDGLNAHVLLVDDHPMNRELGKAFLGLAGCSVETCENGEEAVEAVAAGRFDLILMDVHMPVMDGLAATRAIRKLPGRAAFTPIVAMTADALPKHVQACLAAGMDAHIGKPIQFETLCTVMTELLAASASEELMAAAG